MLGQIRIGLGQFAGLDHPQVHRDAKYAIRIGVQSREEC